MYDSKNLPLSKKKIIKKTIASGGLMPFLAILGVIILGFFSNPVSVTGGDTLSSFFNVVIFWTIIFFIFVFALMTLYQWLYYKFYYYDFQADTAEIKKGVISMATGHVRYSKIQNIFVDQDLLDRIFGLYDVHYETAGEHSGFYSHVDGLNKENSDKLVAFLKERVLKKDTPSQSVPASTELNNPQLITPTASDDATLVIARSNMPLEKRIVPVMIWTRSAGTIIGLLYLSFAFSSNNDWGTTISVGLTFFILVAVPLLSIIANYIYVQIWYKNYNFSFDQKQGLIEEKVIASNQKYLYYNRIQNINVTQRAIDRFFKLYRVTIETASEGTKKSVLAVIGLNKENADKLKDFLISRSSSHQSL